MTSCIRLKSILYINFALIISLAASSGGQSLNYWPANLCEFQCGTIFSLCTFIKNPSNVKPPNYDLHSAFSWRNFTHFLSHLQAPIPIPISIPIQFPFRFPYPFPLPPLRGVIRKRREPELGSGFWVWDSDWAWAWAWAVAPVGVRVPVQFSSVPRGHHYSEFSLLFCSSAVFVWLRTLIAYERGECFFTLLLNLVISLGFGAGEVMAPRFG